jgi:hypothetical protein
VNRLLTVVALAAAGALGAWLAPSHRASAGTAKVRTFAVQVGDRIRVVDAPIGCRIVRMSQLDGRIAIDCRRAGPLSDTYGTLLTRREAAVVRFEANRTARVLVLGTHQGGIRTCGTRR